MADTHRKKPITIPTRLIAPCGMNCRLCWGYVREKNSCPGCLGLDSRESRKSKYRATCKIRYCEQRIKGKTRCCSDRCDRFPCARLKQLDKRYRSKYGMSMIDNLKTIHLTGMRQFIQQEKCRWICPECGELLCVHKQSCLACERKWR